MEDNAYYSDEDEKRLARMLMLSRAESKLSQEKVAFELGVAKKTIQNWEKGVSAPTLPQAIEWFRVLDVAAMPYFLQFMFPGLEGTSGNERVEKLRKELISMIETLPEEGVRQLMFLFYGDHGSSPGGVMNLMTAHLQAPMNDRYRHARNILDDYKLAKEKNELNNEDHIQPNVEFLENAIDCGREAVIKGKNHYLAN